MKRLAIAITCLAVVAICVAVVVIVCAPHDHHGVQRHPALKVAPAPSVRQLIVLFSANAAVPCDASSLHTYATDAASPRELPRGPRLPLLRI